MITSYLFLCSLGFISLNFADRYLKRGLLKNLSRKIKTNAVRRFDGSTIINRQGKVTVSSWFEYK